MLKKVLITLLILVIFTASALVFLGCTPEEYKTPTSYGKFCSLEEAYNEGLLTKQDVRDVAFYKNGKDDVALNGEYIPVNKSLTAEISSDLANGIKLTRIYDLKNSNYKNLTTAMVEDITIKESYIISEKVVVVLIEESYLCYNNVIVDTTIAGITIRHTNANLLKVWSVVDKNQ